VPIERLAREQKKWSDLLDREARTYVRRRDLRDATAMRRQEWFGNGNYRIRVSNLRRRTEMNP
jgi:hypothetical protein